MRASQEPERRTKPFSAVDVVLREGTYHRRLPVLGPLQLWEGLMNGYTLEGSHGIDSKSRGCPVVWVRAVPRALTHPQFYSGRTHVND